MIELINVNKRFGPKTIFQDFNLSIQKGEFVIISGESGSGKTTLLNMIGALEQPDSGQILVDGINIMLKKNQMNYYRNTVGFLFQNFVLLEDKTVCHNLSMIRKGKLSSLTVEDALRKVDLAERINDMIYTLSGGEQQRVALARLMVKKCTLILADEPTGSLDCRNAERVINILHRMNKEGVTILLVTHNEDFKKKGNRVIEL